MALRAVFDRTPREAPKFLPLRGLVRPHLLLGVEDFIACLSADVARPRTLGWRSPSTDRDRARAVALVWLRPYGRAGCFACIRLHLR